MRNKRIIYDGFNNQIVAALKNGGVGVIPTDTIYGLVGSALSRKAVARIYKLRKRNPRKPLIILISSLKDLNLFGVKFNWRTKSISKKIWPGKVSVILSLNTERQVLNKLNYLHRGTKTLAFRLPADRKLRNFLRKTGPLVAPSANFEGQPWAETIKEAREYFGNKINFYVDVGKISGQPSKLVKIERNNILVLRK